MNIGKQWCFSGLCKPKSYRSALIIAGMIWLGINPVFAADEFAVSSEGPAALREPAPVESASSEVPVTDALDTEAPAIEEIPVTNAESTTDEAPASPAATDSTAVTIGNEEPAANKTSTARQVSSDDELPATNVNQEIMTRPDFVDPKVTRNDIHVAAIDNENFEFGLFFGMFSTEDFGTNPVYGLKIAYHVNEAVFFEVTTGITKTQRTSAEVILNVDFLSEEERELTYYNFSFGYNALPSETYFGEGWAFHSAIYVIGGAGFTDFAGDSFFTMNFGVGYRFLVTDWLALHLDVRDHLFEMDLLGEKKTTQNIELTTGVNFFF